MSASRPIRTPELPPVPFDALPVLTERVEEPLPAARARVDSRRDSGARDSSPPPAMRPSATPALDSDPAFSEWLAQRVQALVREEMQLLTERVVARLEWEIAQRRRSEPL